MQTHDVVREFCPLSIGEKLKMMMFPRFFRVCGKDHLTDEDVWLTDRLRRDIDREIRQGI
jgi:hypothetical protein